jgi:hypothetical protein
VRISELLTGLSDASQRLKEMTALVDEAQRRLLVAGTAYVLS